MAKLSDKKIEAAKPKEKSRKIFDSDGLFLLVTPSGGRWWRLRYRWKGKEKLLSLGVYPEIGLKDARARRDALRKQVALGIDPSADRKEKKLAAKAAQRYTFNSVVVDWIKDQLSSRGLTPDHIERVRRRFEVHFSPWLGNRPIADITDDDVRACLMRIKERGLIDTAHRARSQVDQLFVYARAQKIVRQNPVSDLKERGVLPPIVVRHHPSIKDAAGVGVLLRAIDAYQGSPVVKSALRILPYVFVRPGELRHACWEEIQLDGKTPEWRIPAEKMKMREQHIVPLARQVIAILEELRPLTGDDGRGYVFPSIRNAARPMSEATMNVALRAMGYTAEQQTPHGFRSIASTQLNELGWNRDAIERQLAHGERDKVRDFYNFAEYLPLRRKMMQKWADHLDGLRAGTRAVNSKVA